MTRKTRRRSLKMNLMSVDSLKDLGQQERVGRILKMVKENRMIILDGRLDPDEELLLVQETMGGVKDSFPGIEVCTIEREQKKYQELYQKLVEALTRKPASKSGLTFIGPSNIVKKIKKMKESSAFEVLAEI